MENPQRRILLILRSWLSVSMYWCQGWYSQNHYSKHRWGNCHYGQYLYNLCCRWKSSGIPLNVPPKLAFMCPDIGGRIVLPKIIRIIIWIDAITACTDIPFAINGKSNCPLSGCSPKSAFLYPIFVPGYCLTAHKIARSKTECFIVRGFRVGRMF